MLRIVTEWSEAQAELKRICERKHDAAILHKESTVHEILQMVKRQGDAALLTYTEEFDRVKLTVKQLRVSGSEMDAAYQQVSKELLDAIRLAHKQIKRFHQQRIPKSWVEFESDDVILGKRYLPVDCVGLYVPGGCAAYASMVLMNAVPAKVAGVSRIVMVTPPGRGDNLAPALLVAAQEAGIDEIYRIGGAQAIAALAYGTETIPRADMIVGRGNLYVTLAKKLVYGMVGIDSLGGPSEVLVIADSSANPAYLATDLLAQAEYDPLAAAILITPDSAIARQVVNEVAYQLEGHPRQVLTEKSIANYGLVIIVGSLEQATALSNQFAPEHLELAVEEPWNLLNSIHHAGAIFLGSSTPKAVGDYLAGLNHTLPISGSARYASALGVETFLKYSSIVHYPPQALQKVAGAVETLALSEGLFSQANSIRIRVKHG